MKLSAQMVVINEEDYVYYCLKSIYPVVEEIIIVEGADIQRHSKESVERCELTPEGLSGDGTYEQIQRMLDEDVDHKIQYLRKGWVSEMDEIRSICYDKVGKDTDYCVVTDADSLFHPDEILAVRELVETYPNIWAVASEEMMFFWDLQHYLTVAPNKLEYCHFADSSLFWKYREEFSIRGQRPFWQGDRLEIVLPRVASMSGHTEQVNYHPTPPPLHAFHYGWVHTQESMEQHLLRWAHATCHLVRHGGGNPNMQQWCAPILESDDEEILEYYRTYHKVFSGIFDQSVGEHLEEFEGEHPPVMQEHPYWGKTIEEMGWDN